ncbi:MAG: DUF6174 domain-containing protein [Nocardioides sp.]|nr:DUF6174 domain-containing protein [Nocardioides sp.]
MKHAVLATLVPLALVAPAVPAYAVVDPEPVTPFVPDADDDAELATAWQAWQAKGIDDYVLTVRLSCYCPPTDAIRTVIRDDMVRRVSRGDRRLRDHSGYSMDEMFSLISRETVESDRVEVDYSRRGVPRSITIDPVEMAADEETYYTLTLSRLG